MNESFFIFFLVTSAIMAAMPGPAFDSMS